MLSVLIVQNSAAITYYLPACHIFAVRIFVFGKFSFQKQRYEQLLSSFYVQKVILMAFKFKNELVS